MVFVWKITSPDETAPSVLVSALAGFFINLVDISMTVVVDGVTLYTFPIGAGCPIGILYNVGGVVLERTPFGDFRLEVTKPLITDTTQVTINITHVTMGSINRTFPVYGYDLGNQGLAELNPDFTFILKNFTTNVGVTKVVSWRNPKTNELHLLNLTGLHSSEWKLDTGVTIALGDFATVGGDTDIHSYQGKFTNGMITTTKTLFFNEYPKITQKPKVNLLMKQNFVVSETVMNFVSQIESFLQNDKLTKFWVNGTYGSKVVNKFKLKYTFSDYYTHEQLDTVTTADITILPGTQAHQYPLPFFRYDKLYKVTVELIPDVVGMLSDFYEIVVIPSQHTEIKRLECNKFSYTRNEFQDVKIGVSKYDDNNDLVVHQDLQTVLAGGTVEFTFPEDGIYVFQIRTLTNELIYNLNVVVHCKIENALLNLADYILPGGSDCSCNGICKPPVIIASSSKEVRAQNFLALYLIYLGTLQQLGVTYIFFNTVNNSLLTIITKLNLLYKEMLKWI